MANEWSVDVKGSRKSGSWEISVVRNSNEHGFKSYGWFDEDKILVSHNGGPCHWPIPKAVWDGNMKIAEDLCESLNAGNELEA